MISIQGNIPKQIPTAIAVATDRESWEEKETQAIALCFKTLSLGDRILRAISIPITARLLQQHLIEIGKHMPD